MHLSLNDRDYSSYFGLLFVKDLIFRYLLRSTLSFKYYNWESYCNWWKYIKKPLMSRKWFFCTSTALYFVFLHAMIFSLMSTQQHLTKLQRAHKKIIRENKFWCLSVSRASFTKTGDILDNLCSFFRNIVMKWNSDTEKITLLKN